jgi:ribosomal protein S18 acetylase RimI-like enzyme
MIRLRDAVPDDYSLIIDFQIKMAQETEGLSLSAYELTKGVQAVFLFPDKGRYFIAELNDEPCASLMVTYEWSDWRNRTIWWIQSVYVKPEYRRKGVYAAMYTHIQKLANDNAAVGGLRLYVDKTNTSAQKTYQALGMNGDHYKVFEWMKKH